MLEDEVLEKAIGNFKKQGWVCIYRTWPTRSSGSTTNLAGVDAIMSKMNNAKFIFIEAKGSPSSKSAASQSFTTGLGSIIKRVRVKDGYFSNEALECFHGNTRAEREQTRDAVKFHANLQNSEYVLALPQDFKNRAATSVDEEALKMLKIRFLWI